jgi:hypothetical protein
MYNRSLEFFPVGVNITSNHGYWGEFGVKFGFFIYNNQKNQQKGTL